jgi:hypothetical protein
MNSVNSCQAKVSSIFESVAEDFGKCRLRHEFIHNIIRLGTFSNNELVQGRSVEPEMKVVFTLGDFLLLEIIKSLISKERTVSDGHS